VCWKSVTGPDTPIIFPSWRPRLHEDLGGTVCGLGGTPEAAGGATDHIHLLVGLKSTHCLADFVRDLKKSAASWVRDTIEHGDKFSWQNGYAAVSVSVTSRKAVREYIGNQEEHHRTKSFREEWTAMLDKAEIPNDPQYLD
jgi:hypothetical protein